MSEYRSGFVGIVGRPNVGKSTLVNALVGEKVVIVAAKPQTTRQRIRAVLTTPTAQIIFYDTPGLHKPLHRLGEEMNQVALRTFSLVDVILWMIDVTRPVGKGDLWVAERLKEFSGPVLIAFNKIDQVKKFDPEVYLRQLAVPGRPWVKISALTGEGLETLIKKLESFLAPGPKYYPDDMVTDQPQALLFSEFIREAIIHLTEEEIPHSVAVVMEEIKERPNKKFYIRATILVERDSQKKIIIGKNGSQLKKIGTMARAQIETVLGAPVYLDLWVKTKKDWRDSLPVLRELGYMAEGEL